MESDKVTLRGACVQILATFSIAFLALLSGMLFTWPSYNVAKFVANETVLSEPMNSLHVSLLGSLMNIGSIFVTPIFGWAMNKIGPKLTMILVGIPFVIGWIIMCITNSVTWILCAVTIAGCGTAGQASGAIYVSEIAHYSIRGALTSSLLTIYFLGVLLSYVLGGYLTYYQVVYVQLGAAIFNLVLLSFLKDSPVYLLQIGKEKAATESVAFYRQLNPKSKQVQAEIANIKLQLNPRLDKIIDDQEDPTVTKDLLPTEETPQLMGWQFLKQSPSSIRAFITSLLIMATTILMGNVPMQVYSETLFAEALPSYNPNTCSIWLAVVFVIATLVCVMVIDRLGRKFLTIFSCTTSSICTLILGTQTQFKWASEWFTMLVIYLYNFFFNMGIAVIPYVLIGEVFLPEVRGLCGGITVSSGFALNFMITIIFTPVVENYGFTSLFYGFTLIGFAGTVFALFCLPETKELSVDVIQALFLKKTKRKIDA